MQESPFLHHFTFRAAAAGHTGLMGKFCSEGSWGDRRGTAVRKHEAAWGCQGSTQADGRVVPREGLGSGWGAQADRGQW